MVKARFFGSRHSFDESPALDGILLEREGPDLRAEFHGHRPRAINIAVPFSGTAE